MNSTSDYLVIDVGGSRIRGYSSENQLEFQGEGVRHTDSLALDLARNISSAIPPTISTVGTLVLSMAAIPQSEEDRELLAAGIFQRINFSKLVVLSDTQAAAVGNKSTADLVIAIGTGITAMIHSKELTFELTGHGYLIGDEASGYWIGSTGLNAALKGHEGRGPSTSLSKDAAEFFNTGIDELADFVHQLKNPVFKVASFAPSVITAAHTGDAVALEIIDEAAREIVHLIKVAMEKTEIKTVALVGGVVPIDGLVYKRVQALTNGLSVTFVDQPSEPLVGARHLAQEPDKQSQYIEIFTRDIQPETWSKLYLLQIRDLVSAVTSTQERAIADSVQLLADALEQNKMIHTFGTGHSHLLAEEIFYRAGGLAAIHPILDDRLMLHKRVIEGTFNERLPGLAKELLADHPINPGDVLFVISNSGGNLVTTDMVKLAQLAGAKVIALTSISHATSASARSKGGERIHQIADLVLDNSGKVGDAAIELPDSDSAVAPTSTIIGAALLQAIIVGAVSELIKRKITPEVFLSSNLSGGDEKNAAIFDKYRSIIDLYN
jgi:uncharacterized phosphosugar-binding protein/N-acetylglucosamine kinase-like BadF-type ATPase